MTATTLLDSLHRRGITVAAEADALRVKPWSAVPDDLRAEIREHKPQLLQLLSGEWYHPWLRPYRL